MTSNVLCVRPILLFFPGGSSEIVCKPLLLRITVSSTMDDVAVDDIHMSQAIQIIEDLMRHGDL